MTTAAAPRTQQAATKYVGETASGYEARRQSQPKWKAEDRIVRKMLVDLTPGTTILDIPVGTGRFIDHYEERGFRVLGMDISEDMLAIARKKVTGDQVRLVVGDVFKTGLSAKSHDVVVCIRLLNKIAPEDVGRALRELQRVAKRMIIFNVRVWTDGCRWRHAIPFGTVSDAIQPGWKIAEDQPIHEDDFRMVMLVRE